MLRYIPVIGLPGCLLTSGFGYTCAYFGHILLTIDLQLQPFSFSGRTQAQVNKFFIILHIKIQRCSGMERLFFSVVLTSLKIE